MNARTLVLAAMGAALAIPPTAGADQYSGSDCAYTADEQVAHGAYPSLMVYADADGGGGMTGTAITSAGVCVDGLTVPGVDGFTLEAGAGAPTGGPAGYVVFDGDNHSTGPTGAEDGYAGVSNYETGFTGQCDAPPGTGSNSGGCVMVNGLPLRVPGPVACGNTSGNTWSNTNRDGCSIP